MHVTKSNFSIEAKKVKNLKTFFKTGKKKYT